MASRNIIGGTNPEELTRFANALQSFADELSKQISDLVRETEQVTSYSWRGQKAEEFSDIIHDSHDEIAKQVTKMEELSEAIKEKAMQLKSASERRFTR